MRLAPVPSPATLLVVLAVFLTVGAMGASRASAAFGIRSSSTVFSAPGGEALYAGSHPESWTTTLDFNTEGPPGEQVPDGALKDLRIELPPGLVGAPALLPECGRGDFIAEECPAATAVGSLSLEVGESLPVEAPLYLLEAQPGYAAQLGLHAQHVPVTLDLSISPVPPHGLVAEITNASQVAALYGSTLTLDGSPGGIPFLTLPRSCSALQTSFAASSWGAPDTWATALAPEPADAVGCASLSYAPELEVSPTTTAASSPSGLDVDLEAADAGIASSAGRAAADTAAATLELPSGLTVDPPVAAGLEGCTPAQLAGERADADPRTGCPEASRIGSASVTTPLFAKPIAGSIYVAEPYENPFDSLFALYLVLDDPERGVLLDLPIDLEADRANGRLTASFPELPQLPLSQVELRFNRGPRAPLRTPAGCGGGTISFALTPSSGNPPLRGGDGFTTTGNCGSSFSPELDAGTASNSAGSASTFVFSLTSSASEPNPAAVALTLPPGVSAAFGTVPACADADAAQARCPADSRIGYARVALGAGPEPLWVPASRDASDVYLAGPYRGAPHSLLVVVPARAGPFDLGRIALRAPIAIDPETARATVELEGLPQILDGIPLRYRAIRLVIDRPGFVRNPTSCEPAALDARVTAADGRTASTSERFQAADCAGLGFAPGVRLRFDGVASANGRPGLVADLRPRPGQANLEGASLTVPRGELVNAAALRSVCSASEFAASSCPPASAHGSVRATGPGLDGTLAGTLYLREGDSKYPQLAARLSGPPDLTIAAELHTPHGRLRADFTDLPDIPLRSLELRLDGGRRGLLVNSESLCARPRRAGASLAAHNGRRLRLRPRVATGCGSP